MRSAFIADILRSVRGSLGRFLAIMGIVALGCGFYAGLQMCGPDMRAGADQLYDGTNLWDVRLISTLGFADEDVERVRAVEGVRAVMPSLTCDAMARMGSTQDAVRVTSIDPLLAAAGVPAGPYAVSSERQDYLNRPRLVEGRWPEACGECVVSADVPLEDVGIGGTVELLYGSSDLDDLLATRTLTVVGTVSSSNYPYTGSFGSTTLGSGQIAQYLYVAPASLAEDAPYTEIYLTVEGAAEELSESKAYEEVVGATKGRLEDMAAELSHARQDDLRAKAQETLDEKWAEYDEEKAKAEAKLADAAAELEDARKKIADGEAELADGEAQYAEGLAEFERQKADAERQLSDAAAEIRSGQETLDEKRAELEAGARELRQSERQLKEGEAQLKAGEDELAAARDAYEAGAGELEAGRQEYEAGLAAYQEGKAQAEAELAAAAEAIRKAQADGYAQADEALAGPTAAWQAQRAQLAATGEDLAACADALDAVLALAQAGEAPTQEQLGELAGSLQTAAEAAGRLASSPDDEVAAAAAGLPDLMGALASALPDVATGAGMVPAGTSGQLRAAKAQVDAGIAEGDEQLAAAREAAHAQVDAQVAPAWEEYESQKAATEQRLAAGWEELEAARETVEAGQAELDEARAQIEAGQAELEKNRAKLAEGRAELEAGRARIAEGRSQIRDGQRQLDEARGQLLSATAEAYRQIAAAQDELDEAAATLADGRAELEDARAKYREGADEYRRGRREADEEFADALAKLEDAQHEIDTIELPDIYALDRTQSEGAATYHADARRIDAIADVFPFVFFLVAALVALTTMTRMVEDDRVLIGTYKALGYGTAAIAGKYLAYAGVAGTVGAVAGIAVLSQVLPYIVMSAYSIIYTVPIQAFPLPVDAGIVLASGGLGVGVTLLATWGAVVSSLRESPASLMLPRAPKAGKRILLERVRPVWERLSFTWKVTFRNLFRYKRRFLMTVIGISGCAALLLVGFGLHDSIWDIIDCQYGPIIHFDTTVGLDDNALGPDVRRVCDYLASTGEVEGIVRVQNENMQARSETADETIRVNVVIPRDADEMAGAVTFRNRVTGAPIELGPDSVIVTEKLALKYGLDVGDDVVLLDQDDVGNAVGEGHALAITGVAENYVGNLVYVGRAAWRQVSPEKPVFTTVYASTTEDAAVRARIADDLHDMEDVSTVVFSDETINMYRQMLSVVDMIVVVLIVSAAALAYIVLYNLTNINIGERVREIASLKVLGFTRQEVYSYIFREIALLAAIGDVVGMGFGVVLERFVVTTAEVDYVMFGRTIHPPSYAFAFVLTMVFTALVILSMRRKLDRVDMVESLKSVD